MLTVGNAVLVLVDVQGKLAQIMFEKDALFTNLQKLVRGMQALSVPIIWLEQNPERMGATIPELRELLASATPIHKMSFSCCGEPVFVARLEALGRRQALLAGIEAHVCVYQTAADLVRRGGEVEVVADAVSSRTSANREIGLERARGAGARLTSVETCLFELLGTAEHAAFKDILRIVK
jgi:nicotinamidase-related amidase